MKLSGLNLREKLSRSVQAIFNIRLAVSRSTLLTFSALTLILFLAFSIRMFPTRWGLELSEFDPYFQFRFSEHVLNTGYVDWGTWYDTQRWYPLGYTINIARTAFPGLPFTAAVSYNFLSILGVPISLYHFCILFPAVFGTLACLMAFFFAKDIGGKIVGLLSAFFLALNPSHITRTAAGFFDDETVGIGSILLFGFLFLRALDEDRSQKEGILYAVTAGLALGYVAASWGAALYPIAMATLFVFALILLKRYSRRLFLSYSLTFGLGLFLAINVPKHGIDFLSTWAVLPVLGVFGLLGLHEFLNALKTARSKIISVAAFLILILVGLLALSFLGYMGSIGPKFIRVVNPLQRGESEIYQSVQEHRLTAWGSIYYDYGVGVLFFALGLFFAARNLTSRHLFIIIFGISTLYFASSMVRLTILLAPAFCVLMAIGLTTLMKPFITVMRETEKFSSSKKYIAGHVGKEFSASVLILMFLLLTFTYVFPSPRVYTHAYSPPTILSASVPLRTTQSVTEWTEMLSWMRTNLPTPSIVCSWWDYGYWITIKGNQTSLADNATFNQTHIGNIGLVFMSNETEAVRILEEGFNGPDGPPTHILVFTTFNSLGGDQGYGDEGKWRWMARIANQTVNPGFYFEWGEREEFNTFGNITENQWQWNDVGKNTTVYKLMQAGKNSIVPSAEAVELEYFEVEHFSPGNPVASIGTDQSGQPVYLYALVCLYKINYS